MTQELRSMTVLQTRQQSACGWPDMYIVHVHLRVHVVFAIFPIISDLNVWANVALCHWIFQQTVHFAGL